MVSPFDVLAPVGLLTHWPNGEEPTPVGTCFAFRQPNVALTAAHCVNDMAADELSVGFLRRGVLFDVVDVVCHASADIALIRGEPTKDDGEDSGAYFRDFVGNFQLGEDFFAYGYPKGGPTGDLKRDMEDPNVVTPRLFKGHFQRFFIHQHLSYRYSAAELSISAPLGLSGSPLIRPGAPSLVTGLVSGEIALESELGTRTTMITYGVAVMLMDINEWLDDQVRRAK